MAEKINPARARFAWLDAVATDARLPPLAVRVAVVLGRWLNAEGVAWPAVATIAAALGATDRAVQKAISALVEAGHIAVERRRGRGHTNEITIRPPVEIGERADTFSSAEKVNSKTRKGERLSQKRRTCGHPNQEKNQGDPLGLPLEPRNRRDARAPEGAALGDLSTLPFDIRVDVEAHERRLVEGVREGQITPSEANEHRRERAKRIAQMMEATAHG